MAASEKTIPPVGRWRLADAVADLARLSTETDRKEDAEKWAKLLRERDGRLIEKVHDASENLTLTDRLDAKTAAVIFQVRLAANVGYVIDMVSPDGKALDPYLYVRDSDRAILAEDDDNGGDLNARILFRPRTDGVYQLRATSFNSGNGPFTLTVRRAE
jgi:hypothetical protein